MENDVFVLPERFAQVVNPFADYSQDFAEKAERVQEEAQSYVMAEPEVPAELCFDMASYEAEVRAFYDSHFEGIGMYEMAVSVAAYEYPGAL